MMSKTLTKTMSVASTILFLFAIGLIAGCGGNHQTSPARQDSTPNDQNGTDLGDYYTSGNESPGFNDQEILAMTEDQIYNDPFDPNSPATSSTIYLKVVWGNLIYDPDATTVRDYSGTMVIDDGLLVIERTVLFEGSDSEIIVRNNPSLVAWKSHILPHYDGLVLRLDPGSAPDEKNYLHMNIGPYTAEFSVAELQALEEIDPTGYSDQHVAIASRLGEGASDGFLTGHWRDLPDHPGGVFKGKWENGSGTLMGYERCRYIPEGEGQGIVRGKYIDMEGNFKGFLSGDYERTSTEYQVGTFHLDWLDMNKEKIGKAEGIYFKKGSKGYGFAMGNWWAE